MADEVKVTITGLDEAIKMLDELPDEIVSKAFAEALAPAAIPIYEETQALTPIETGQMKNGLKTKLELDKSHKGGRASIGFFGRFAPKARWVEFGHRMVGHKPDKKELGKVRAHPFMRPAAKIAKDRAVAAFKSVIERFTTEKNNTKQ